jgi:hypothetical protein
VFLTFLTEHITTAPVVDAVYPGFKTCKESTYDLFAASVGINGVGTFAKSIAIHIKNT